MEPRGLTQQIIGLKAKVSFRVNLYTCRQETSLSVMEILGVIDGIERQLKRKKSALNVIQSNPIHFIYIARV